MVSKNKRSSPKLRLIFWLKSEIQTLFQAEARYVLHNFGTQFPLGGAVFNFSPKIGLKSTKNVRFCILHMPMPTPTPPGYATGLEGKKPIKRYYLMLIFVEGANCRCLHFCFLVVNALNLFLVQVPCTWTEFEVVALQCDKIWSRKVKQNSSDLKVIVFSLILLKRSFVV